MTTFIPNYTLRTKDPGLPAPVRPNEPFWDPMSHFVLSYFRVLTILNVTLGVGDEMEENIFWVISSYVS